jgi:hypothetical protein
LRYNNALLYHSITVSNIHGLGAVPPCEPIGTINGLNKY